MELLDFFYEAMMFLLSLIGLGDDDDYPPTAGANLCTTATLALS